jgi:GTP-binding protein
VPFTDRAHIHVEGGGGGNGALSFRREPHVPRGGPDGGNGGRGGGVVLIADPQVTDLSRFRHAVHHRGPSGAPGQGKGRHGKAGADLEVGVPPGTRVLRDGHPIAELARPGERVAVARGGSGGVGNRAFRSSTRQAPRITIPGSAGEQAWLTLELRLPVDVALVGLPNSGKSAVLTALTGAAAVVAPYPHSTLEPALGPLEDADGHLYLVADLPGLAADGTPRRDAHLLQLERARLLLHCVDASAGEPVEALLQCARPALSEFAAPGVRELVVATRADPAAPPEGADLGVDVETGAGVEELRRRIISELTA